MARPIVLSNGELHVGLNNFGLVHDFYFPYVGFENHSAGKSTRHRVGVWVDGNLSWLDSDEWSFSFTYPHQALIGHTIATNELLGVRLEFDDAVDSEMSIFMRSIHVMNLRNDIREIRLFMHQAFAIGDSRSNTDTAQFLPDLHAILHYRGRRAFIIAAEHDGKPFDQHSIGLFDIEGHEGTYRDADDGELSMGTVEHGRVDSTIRLSFQLAGHDSTRVHYWISCGTSHREAAYIHKTALKNTISKRLSTTASWWHKWLEPTIEKSLYLPEEYREPLIQSVMLIKSQIDKRGAVIASTDTAMLNYSRDTYAYCWPRDGANVVWPLIRLGYHDEPYQFFAFCRRVMSSRGYLMHKFRADGALGSSWHSYSVGNDTVTPPIQEDETALVLFVFGQFYHEQQDERLLKEFYGSMVVPMADFLTEFIDTRTGLPKPSYDLWEERFATFTYTTAVTYAALLSAASLAEIMLDENSAVKWRAAAEDIRQRAQKSLYNPQRKAFYKSISMNQSGELSNDETIDISSFYGSYMFGLFPLEGREVRAAAKTIEDTFGLGVNGDFGLGRYENDTYRRDDDSLMGNWWPLISLWYAQYTLEVGDDQKSESIIRWVLSQVSESGVLPEQIHPITKNHVSVSPLTWSHAELVSTLLDLASNRDGI